MVLDDEDSGETMTEREPLRQTELFVQGYPLLFLFSKSSIDIQAGKRVRPRPVSDYKQKKKSICLAQSISKCNLQK